MSLKTENPRSRLHVQRAARSRSGPPHNGQRRAQTHESSVDSMSRLTMIHQPLEASTTIWTPNLLDLATTVVKTQTEASIAELLLATPSDHFKISNHETFSVPTCYEHYHELSTSKNSQTFRSNLQLFTDDDATPPDETSLIQNVKQLKTLKTFRTCWTLQQY
jgi:hypothetical protein